MKLLLVTLATAGDALDFDALGGDAAVVPVGDSPIGPWLATGLCLATVLFAGWSGRSVTRPATFELGALPGGARLAIVATLGLYGLVHLLGAAAVAVQTRDTFSTAEDYFRSLSIARLAGLSHAHLFGIGTLQAFGALVYSLTRRDGAWPRAVCCLAFVGVVADIGAWWLIRSRGGAWEQLSMFGGLACAAAYSWMFVAVGIDLARGGR